MPIPPTINPAIMAAHEEHMKRQAEHINEHQGRSIYAMFFAAAITGLLAAKDSHMLSPGDVATRAERIATASAKRLGYTVQLAGQKEG